MGVTREGDPPIDPARGINMAKNSKSKTTTKKVTSQAVLHALLGGAADAAGATEDTPLPLHKDTPQGTIATKATEAKPGPSRKRNLPEGSDSESGSEGTAYPQKKRVEDVFHDVFYQQKLYEAEMSSVSSEEETKERDLTPVETLIGWCDILMKKWHTRHEFSEGWKTAFSARLENAKSSNLEFETLRVRVERAEKRIRSLEKENARLKSGAKPKSLNKEAQTVEIKTTTRKQQKEQGTQQEKTKAQIQQQKPNMARSYATVAMSKRQLIENKPLRHFVTVYQDDNLTNSEQTKKALTECFNPVNEKLHLKAVKKVHMGGLFIETETKEDLEKLLKCKSITDKGLRIGVPLKKNPKLVIYNAPPDMSDKQLLAALSKQNDLPSEMEKTIRPLFKTGKEITNWVIDTSPQTRAYLLKKGRVYLEWQSCQVRDYIVAGRCYHCQAFGHIARHCRAKIEACGHCAQEGHTFKKCKNKDKEPACINCKRAKRPHKHSSRSDECPAYKLAIENLIGKTDYGD